MGNEITPNADSEQGQINRLNIEVIGLKLEVAALKQSNNWFFVKVSIWVVLYDIISGLVEKGGNSLGWW